MRTRTRHIYPFAGNAAETALLMEPIRQVPIEQRRAIIALHGHGANSLVWLPGWAGARHCQVLAEAGYTVLSIDAGGPATYNNKAATDAITAAYNWLITTYGLASTKVGLYGWSMGGGNSLQWIKENPTKVFAALLWCPLTDLDYHVGTNPAVGSEAYIAYGTPIYPTNDYALNSTGHKIADEYPTWRDKCPIRIIQGLADTTVPPAKSTAFINGVNQPQVDMISLTGSDHTNLFANIDPSTTLEFFRENDEDLSVYVPNPLKLLSPETSKYQDSARTTLAVANNDPVGSWTDAFGGLHAIQATAGKRPLLKTAVLNGYDVVQWDGVDDYMESAMTAKPSHTIFLVMRKLTNAVVGKTGFGLKFNSSNRIGAYNIADGYEFFANEAFTSSRIATVDPTQWHIMSFRVVSSDLVEVRTDGGAPVTFNPSDIAITAVALMLGSSNNTAGSFGDYQFAEISRYDGAMTLDQIDVVGENLSAKYVLPWATALA